MSDDLPSERHAYQQLERGDCGCGRRFVWLYQRVGTLMRGCGHCVMRVELGYLAHDARLSSALEKYGRATTECAIRMRTWRARQKAKRAA